MQEKMQKYILKQQFKGFSISNLEGLHKGYDRFQSLLSQLEIHGADRARSGHPAIDDLYNNQRVFENDVKGSTTSPSSTQNVAFVFENTISTNDVTTAYGVSNPSGHNSQCHDFNKEEIVPNKKDRECRTKGNQDNRRRDAWNSRNKDGRRSEEEEGYALMACNSSGSNTVREQLSNASIEIQAYTQGLKKVKAQLVAHQQGQLCDETHEPLPEPTVNEPKVVSQPKVLSNAPIIEEYESDSEDEHRMAKQAELNNRMSKKSSQREIRPIWNNVQRVNHKNQFEFKNRDFIKFYGSKGIKREYSNARTPQQNGVAERKNRTLIKAARTMLADSFLPNTFWAEAVSTACYVLNRVLVTKPHNKTPYELVTGKGPTWLFDLDYLIDSMNYQPVRSENQANKHAGPQKANQNAGTKDIIDAGNSEKEAESAQDYFVLPIWSSYSLTVKRSTAKDACEAPTKHPYLKTNEKPVDKEDQVFLDELERLKREEQDANDAAEALRKEFAQETEDLLLQAGAAKASSTNIVNTASTLVSIASPYGGISFTDLTNPDQDDSEIAALEDIYNNPTDGIFTNSSYDDEGAVADFTNLELVVNVSPIPTSRINSIHPSTLIIGDPQSQKNYCNSRFKKVWYSCIFAYWEEGTFEQKWVYTETDKYEERSCIGRNNQEILKKFDFVSVKTASTLIETQKPLVKDEEASDVDVHLYRSMIGSLMYFNCDLVLKNVAVYACSRFPGHSKDLSTKSVKRIFRYTKGQTKNWAFCILECPHLTWKPIPDSDYVSGANLDRKSTTGGCQFLGRRLISWQCKKLTIVATSTIKEKYVAATNCCGQVLWIQNQMLDYREFWWNHGDQAKEIKHLKAQINKLKKQAKPVITHHRAWMKSVSLKQRLAGKKTLKANWMQKESVSKQGRKSAKAEPSVHTNPLFDELPDDTMDYMDTEDAQDVGRTRDVVNEEKETADDKVSTEGVVSTDRSKVSTDRSRDSTDKEKEGTDKEKEGTDKEKDSTVSLDEGTDDRTEARSATPITSTTTPTMFGDDETIAQVLLNMSQAKAVSREKEKGVELKDVEETERPRPTSTRSLLTLKPLPKIDPKDKGKKKIEEEDESDTESEDIPEAEKKFKQLARDEEMARKLQEDWETEEERKRLAEEEATKTALSDEYDFIQARIEADRLLALRLQDEEREQFTIEERAKFLHDTIAAQRRFLTKQRAIAIRNKPPTRTQLMNQMMTYLKHVGNKKHSDLKSKTFKEIQALYEKVKRFDESFTDVGSTEDEKRIKDMNEGVKEADQKRLKEEDTVQVTAKEEVKEQGTKKRKGGHIKMIARKKPRKQSDVDNDDEHRKCLKIVTFEGTIDSEIMEKKSFIARLNKVSSPDGDYLVIYR
ncbi:putative ribonuclease H-like domain-containing protein, partial [Tanacetum coccineum]